MLSSLYRQLEKEGATWLKKHFAHLNAIEEYTTLEKLMYYDLLLYKEQILSWHQISKNILCIKYDALWNNLSELEKFCRIQISLPEFRQRNETYKHTGKLVEELDLFYESMPNLTIL